MKRVRSPALSSAASAASSPKRLGIDPYRFRSSCGCRRASSLCREENDSRMAAARSTCSAVTHSVQSACLTLPFSLPSPWFSTPQSFCTKRGGIRQDKASGVSDHIRGNMATRARTSPRRSVQRARLGSMHSATSSGGFHVHDSGEMAATASCASC